jgi:hypothetical protein
VKKNRMTMQSASNQKHTISSPSIRHPQRSSKMKANDKIIQSMGGDDNTDSSEKYNVGGNDNAESSEEYNSDSSSESPTPQLNKKTHGKLNSDKVPKAMMYTMTHYDDETVEIAKHREIFMDRAFSEVDNNVDGLEDTRESSLRSQQELDDISYILTHWGIGINLKQVTDMNLRKKLSSFRKKNKVGAHHVDKYHTEEITLPSGERRKILRRIEKGSVGRIVLSRERIFDAIKEWHYDGEGHFGQERTWVLCRQKYWNCTQALVRLFCALCPGCLQKNPTIKPRKGSRVSLHSRQFRERFQVDLIDMRKLRKRNPYGVLMRWIVTIKDHATG